MDFSIKMELVSLLITMLLWFFHYDRHNRSNQRYQLFSLCLLVSGISIFLDIVTSLTIDHVLQGPFALDYGLNTLYFMVQHITFSLMAGYCFYLMFEHVADRHCFYIAIGIITTLCLILLAMIATNPWTDWFFYYVDGNYQRGPFNKLGYGALGLELLLLCICYMRNRSLVSRAMHKLMHIMPPIILLLGCIQLLYPNQLLAGTISTLANLILFISFQSNRIGLDSLTELPVRNTFFQELPVRRRHRASQHILLIYLEHFERINQKYGTRKGDTLLYSIARYLDQLSPCYQAFRFGNTRFLLWGGYQDETQNITMARQIQQRFSEPWISVSSDCYLQVSLAHMILEPEDTDENRILDQLEYTLSQAQKAGAGHIAFFDNRLRAQFDRQLYVLEQIKKALENQSFQVYFQPVYNCREHGFTAAESLLRLFDEQGVLISPGEFIPLAEQNGLIDQISWQLLEKVCRFLAQHPQLPLQSISINLAIQQLTDRSFLQRLHSCQTRHGISASRLRIEITERTITENQALVQTLMDQLTSEGLKFYLDDFGIGYSNLASMMALPFETVKLDATLLQDIVTSQKSCQTVRLLVQMLHNAGFLVVAEGLETRQQVEKAMELSVDCIQGYYYARPMPEDQLEAFLLQQRTASTV